MEALVFLGKLAVACIAYGIIRRVQCFAAAKLEAYVTRKDRLPNR